jgi:hypothetical protein
MAVQAGRGLLGYGGVRYVRARRFRRVVVRYGAARPVEAVEVCSGKSWIGTARLGGRGVLRSGEA